MRTLLRYYVWLAATALGLAAILGAVQLIQWWGNVDITVSLRTLNQAIAPASIACPRAYYPADSIAVCELNSNKVRGPVRLEVSGTGVTFVDQKRLEELIQISRTF